MHIEFTNQTKRKVNTAPLKRIIAVAEKVLDKRLKSYSPKGVPVKNLGLNIFFVSDKEIHRINREYRGKDKPTDVITFSFVETKDFMPFAPGEVFPAGEIFLSLETIARQAKEKHLEKDDELMYMLIHGFLHTFGYDHQDDKQEREMELASYNILGKKYPRKDEFRFV